MLDASTLLLHEAVWSDKDCLGSRKGVVIGLDVFTAAKRKEEGIQ